MGFHGVYVCKMLYDILKIVRFIVATGSSAHELLPQLIS